MGEDVKAYKTYAEQVDILAGRGMDMGDRDAAVETLRRVNYYRLSGYWYPFRKQTPSGREDDFYVGARFSDVVALYEFDVRLRAATFAAWHRSSWQSALCSVTNSGASTRARTSSRRSSAPPPAAATSTRSGFVATRTS